jgi:hypothetical protein
MKSQRVPTAGFLASLPVALFGIQDFMLHALRGCVGECDETSRPR